MKDLELILAGMDLQDLMKRLLNNKALVKIFVKKFIDDETYITLENAIVEGDLEKAEKATHMLKGMCGNLSLKPLFNLFQEQLRLFRVGECEKAVEMMSEIAPAYQGAISHMKVWLKNQ